MSQLSLDTIKKMEAMKARYVASLSQKLSDISSAGESYFSSQGQSENRAALKTLVHQMAGSAGMYGLDEMGDKARKCDGLLSKKTDFFDSKTELEQALEALKEHIAKIS